MYVTRNTRIQSRTRLRAQTRQEEKHKKKAVKNLPNAPNVTLYREPSVRTVHATLSETKNENRNLKTKKNK